ncbi:MAG: serine protease [Granulosicoccaceae bacterium]
MLHDMKQCIATRTRYAILSFIGIAATMHPAIADDLTDSLGNNVIDDSTVAVIDKTTRIIGGNISAADQFPFMVALVRNTSGPLINRKMCGATIISEKWLLTAAHCMFNLFGFRITPESFKAVVGATNLRTQSPAELVVANYYIHPEYISDVDSLENDIALVELANVMPQAQTAPISLYNESAEGLVGVSSTIIGYGAKQYISADNVVQSDVLRHASVPIVSKQVCNAPISYNNTINDSHICAGFARGGVDSCNGDSGGPLIAVLDGVTTQLGVVSSGNGCALPQFYGLYTDVGLYVDWIQQYTRISTVNKPDIVERGGTAGSGSGSGSGLGAAWLLLWLMAGVFIRRRV